MVRKPKSGETTPSSKEEYEQSYGDAEPGGWAPRRRVEDVEERSRYSSQRDRQEDRSGFRRGYQGQDEVLERHLWGARHARGDEDDEPEATEPGEIVNAAGVEAEAWIEERVSATRRRASRKPGSRSGKKTKARKVAGRSQRKVAGRSHRKVTGKSKRSAANGSKKRATRKSRGARSAKRRTSAR
jgi:hypothetical protein